MRVLMLPSLYHFRNDESGIKQVLIHYHKYLPQFGVELVGEDDPVDLIASHAASYDAPEVLHVHGLYWTADYDATAGEYEANAHIIDAARQAKQIIVPSAWVAESFQRDMRLSPHVIGHGVEWDEWQHNETCEGYVIGYAKNRAGYDVCDPSFLGKLAIRFPKVDFYSTFAPSQQRTDNIIVTGRLAHADMRRVIQRAAVYVSPVKETWGVQTVEAMAAGIPVLGWANGGNLDLIRHGVNGYLARPGDMDDLAEGLAYCLAHRAVLGANGRELARAYTWAAACEKVARVYELALKEEAPTVSVVIPVYNKTAEQVDRAISSVLAQTHRPDKIIIVNDGSQNSESIAQLIEVEYDGLVEYVYQNNQGVANARNNGIAKTNSKYIACLDSDDWLEPAFLEACVKALESDRALGIAYTGLHWHKPDGTDGISPWPGAWVYDDQLRRKNQVPTACVFRRVMWERLGGYRQRYAPGGAGSEDAEYFTRAGAYGFKGAKVTEEALFNYSWLSGQVTSNPNYSEPDWLAWHPWSRDSQHPFASYAKPKRQSHPVRQYDDPLISVVIPVGPGHEKDVINALDSLEAQTFRKWEVIVVNDTGNMDFEDQLKQSYPYAILDGNFILKGAGLARNRGAKIARAPLLLFLDADDTLHPDALESMLAAWNEHQKAVYTDYVGHSFIDSTLAAKLQGEGRLEYYNPADGEAIVKYTAFDFDCARARRQPDNEGGLYIWNLITTLHPKAWHDEIGGFDESMQTWEDWDYWIRIARRGHCFVHLATPLVRYRFYTGQRRALADGDTQEGRQIAQSMLKYLRQKYDALGEPMACGCNDKKNGNGASAATVAGGVVPTMADDDFQVATYTGPRGKHQVSGVFQLDYKPQGFKLRQKDPSHWVIDYGYISEGDKRLVHREDIRLMPGKWRKEVVIANTVPQPAQRVIEAPRAIGQDLISQSRDNPPDLSFLRRQQDFLQSEGVDGKAIIEGMVAGMNSTAEQIAGLIKPLDLQTLPGVSALIAEQMQGAGLVTQESILRAGVAGLVALKGVGETKAEIILRAVEKLGE